MGKDGLVIVQGYAYIAPTALPYFMLLGTPGHRCAVTRGYGYDAPKVLGLLVSYKDVFTISLSGHTSFSIILRSDYSIKKLAFSFSSE
jgi:hypothetical protein